ncbi:MAG: hypothetical protein PHW74_11675 [Desulfobacca sp.]|nr:hypothetical protein [Desulfobacca sp.]
MGRFEILQDRCRHCAKARRYAPDHICKGADGCYHICRQPQNAEEYQMLLLACEQCPFRAITALKSTELEQDDSRLAAGKH